MKKNGYWYVAAILGVGIAALGIAGSPALAAGDLRASGFEVLALGGGQFRVTIEHEAAWEASQGPFSYSIVVTQRRNGELVGIPFQATESIVPLSVCSAPCGGGGCEGECHYKVSPDPTIWGANCRTIEKLCPLDKPPNERTLPGCTCPRSDHGGAQFEIEVMSGDTLTLKLDPSPAFDDLRPGNDALTIAVR